MNILMKSTRTQIFLFDIMRLWTRLEKKVTGLSRECYIGGVWNKESVKEWLTEILLPIEGND